VPPEQERDRKAITAALKKFTTSCGQPTNKWRPLGAVAHITGVSFFDIPHIRKPHAENFAELHRSPRSDGTTPSDAPISGCYHGREKILSVSIETEILSDWR
jgi:hypothetical protein